MFQKMLGALMAVVMAGSLVGGVTFASATDQKDLQDVGVFDFSQFGGQTGSAGIVDGKTPIMAEETTENYALRFGSGWSDTPGTPVIVGDSLYCLVAGQNKLYRVNKNTGATIATVPCNGVSQYFSLIAAGDGKIFVPRNVQVAGKYTTVVIAYDADTLAQLWVSQPVGDLSDGVSPLGVITYYDGYLYLGVSNANGAKGAFACMASADTDTDQNNETQPLTWLYQPQEPMKTGYYWCGGAVAENAIVFAGEATELVSHSLTTNKVYDRLVLEDTPSGIRSVPCYDPVTRRVFVTAKSGTVYSVRLNADQTFDASSVQRTDLGGSVTASPVVFGGRVYVGGGGVASNYGLSVLDANTLRVIYQIDDFKSQSSPVLTTAYATAENNGKVVLYLTDFQKSYLYAVSDKPGQTVPSFEKIAIPSKTQYCSQSVAIDDNGQIFYYNDGGTIFCFGRKNGADMGYTDADVTQSIQLYANSPAANRSLVALRRIKARLDGLKNPAQVANAALLDEMLHAAEAAKDHLAVVQKLNLELAALDATTVTLADETTITNWLALYHTLQEAEQAKVERRDVLLAAAARLQALKNTQMVEKLQQMIDALPGEKLLTLGDAPEVDRIWTLLTAQNEAVKNGVNQTALLRAKEILAGQKQTVQQLDSQIIEQLNPMNITLADQAKVQRLDAAFAALPQQNRTAVANADLLAFAKSVIASLDKGIIPAQVFENLFGTDARYSYAGEGFVLTFCGKKLQSVTTDYKVQILATRQGNDLEIAVGEGLPGEVLLQMETTLANGRYPVTAAGKQVGFADVADHMLAFWVTQGGTYRIGTNQINPQTGTTFRMELAGGMAFAVALVAAGFVWMPKRKKSNGRA